MKTSLFESHAADAFVAPPAPVEARNGVCSRPFVPIISRSVPGYPGTENTKERVVFQRTPRDVGTVAETRAGRVTSTTYQGTRLPDYARRRSSYGGVEHVRQSHDVTISRQTHGGGYTSEAVTNRAMCSRSWLSWSPPASRQSGTCRRRTPRTRPWWPALPLNLQDKVAPVSAVQFLANLVDGWWYDHVHAPLTNAYWSSG